jgi:hypothetical protein
MKRRTKVEIHKADSISEHPALQRKSQKNQDICIERLESYSVAFYCPPY